MSTREDDVLVDVGIPTRGTSRYIGATIESVLAQTVTAWRIVVSQSGPASDLVLRMLEPYLSDPRISYIDSDEPLGLGANHTRVINVGSAPYVAVLHDDDRWHPTFLERRVAFLDAHPSCGFVFSGHVVIDESGAPLGRTRPRLSPGLHRSADVWPLLYRGNFVGVPTVLVRRSAYEAIGGAYKDIIYCDYEMWVRLAAHFDVGFLGVWDADYRLHPGQTSASKTGLAEEQFAVLDALADLPAPKSLRRYVTAEAHVRSALDAVGRRDRSAALRHVTGAVRADPRVLTRPFHALRIATVLAAVVTGERGAEALARARTRRWRKGGAEGLLPPAPAGEQTERGVVEAAAS